MIAVTGSVGKTSTKDAIYAAVKGSLSARKSERSINSEIGVPLSVTPDFGNTLYSDEKIIRKVCLDLLDKVLKKQYQY